MKEIKAASYQVKVDGGAWEDVQLRLRSLEILVKEITQPGYGEMCDHEYGDFATLCAFVKERNHAPVVT